MTMFGRQKHKGNPRKAVGTVTATAGVALGAAFAMNDSFAQAQVPGIGLPGAQYSVLTNGNALITYGGKTFSVPGGQFSELNGTLFISQTFAQQFTPDAIAMQQMQQAAPQPYAPPSAPQLIQVQNLQPQQANQALAYQSSGYAVANQPTGIAQVNPFTAPPSSQPLVPAPTPVPTGQPVGMMDGFMGGLGSMAGPNFGNTAIMLGGLAVAGGVAYFALNEEDDNNNTTTPAPAADPVTDGPDWKSAAVSLTKAETLDAGTVLQDLTSLRSDELSTDIYTITSGNSANKFSISGGNLVVATGGLHDSDTTDTTYTLTIEAKDANDETSDKQVTVKVTDDDSVVADDAEQTIDVAGDFYAGLASGDTDLGPLQFFGFAMDKGALNSATSNQLVMFVEGDKQNDANNDTWKIIGYEKVSNFGTVGKQTFSESYDSSQSVDDDLAFLYYDHGDNTGSNTVIGLDDVGGIKVDGSAATRGAMQIDLDGDGSQDTLTLKAENSTENSLTITMAGGTVYDTKNLNSNFKGEWFDIGDADGDGNIDEVIVMDDDGVLNIFEFTIDFNGELAVQELTTGKLAGLDLDDLADGSRNGSATNDTAKTFLWIDSDQVDGNSDQLLVTSATHAYIYDIADF